MNCFNFVYLHTGRDLPFVTLSILNFSDLPLFLYMPIYRNNIFLLRETENVQKEITFTICSCHIATSVMMKYFKNTHICKY